MEQYLKQFGTYLAENKKSKKKKTNIQMFVFFFLCICLGLIVFMYKNGTFWNMFTFKIGMTAKIGIS